MLVLLNLVFGGSMCGNHTDGEGIVVLVVMVVFHYLLYTRGISLFLSCRRL